METSNRKKRGDGVGFFVHKKATKKRIASVDTNILQAASLGIDFSNKTHLVTLKHTLLKNFFLYWSNKYNTRYSTYHLWGPKCYFFEEIGKFEPNN